MSKCFYLLSTLILTISLITGGCWNRREPEQMAHVIALGFDYVEESSQYKVIAQITNPAAISGGATGGGGGSGKAAPFWTISALGHTPFEAVRDLAKESTRQMFFAHTGVYLFSEELARKGLNPVFDLLERGSQMRLIGRVAVVRGDIELAMGAEYPLEETGGLGLRRLIDLIETERSLFPSRDLREVLIAFAQPGRQMAIGRLDVKIEEEEESKGTAARGAVEASGAAVFRDDRLVGWFDERETTGWRWIRGEGRLAPLVLKAPGDELPVSVEVFASRASLEPLVEGDDVRIRIKVEVSGRLADQVSAEGFDLKDKKIDSLNRRMAQVVCNDIEIALHKAQELNSDVFGFGNLIYRKLPQEWKRLEGRWDEIFPTLPVEIEVNATVRRTGMIREPIKSR